MPETVDFVRLAPTRDNRLVIVGGCGGIARPPDAPNAVPRMDRAANAREIPLGRRAQAADMVGPILFLLGPGAGFVRGQVRHVNGAGMMQ